jgi:uncharacterized membrane protein
VRFYLIRDFVLLVRFWVTAQLLLPLSSLTRHKAIVWHFVTGIMAKPIVKTRLFLMRETFYKKEIQGVFWQYAKTAVPLP